MSAARPAEHSEGLATPSSAVKGQVVTFYSYKGGVGRSMAVANVAVLLAQAGRRILAIDFDFEAPGLHRYFAGTTEASLKGDRPGMIELLHRLRSELDEPRSQPPPSHDEGENKLPPPLQAQRRRNAEALRAQTIVARILDGGAHVQKTTLKNPNGSAPAHVDLMTAGQFDDEYPNRVRAFDWMAFYEAHPLAFRAMAEELSRRYEYVLIDSRTGITDIGSVCTVLLPEKLVLVFAPNEQSLNGATQIGRQAVEVRKKSSDMRPLPLFPLVSRVENAEDDLQRQWIADAKARFEALFREVYGLEKENSDLTAYFDAVRIPHKSKYAFGEQIAAEQQRIAEDGSLAGAYQQLAQALQCNTVMDAQPQLLSRHIQPSQAQTVAAAAEERAREAEAKMALIETEKDLLEKRLAERPVGLATARQLFWLKMTLGVVAVALVATSGIYFQLQKREQARDLEWRENFQNCINTGLGKLSEKERLQLVNEILEEELQKHVPRAGGALYRASLDDDLRGGIDGCRKQFGLTSLGFILPIRLLEKGQPVVETGVTWGNLSCTTDPAGECIFITPSVPPMHEQMMVHFPKRPPPFVEIPEIAPYGPTVINVDDTPPTVTQSPLPPGALVLDGRSNYLARAVVNTIETYSPDDDYFLSALRTRGPQEIAGKQGLYRLVKRYVAGKGKYAEDLNGFLLLVDKGDRGVQADGAFRALLAQVARDPVMVTLSAGFLTEQFWTPALERAGELGLKSPLAAAILYDTLLYSFKALDDTVAATTKRLDGTPLSGADEKKWMTTFLEMRRVRKESAPELLKLASQDNWELRDPVKVRNETITARPAPDRVDPKTGQSPPGAPTDGKVPIFRK